MSLGLKAKVVVHTRCHIEDARAAVATGVNGVSMYMATSEALRKHSHGKGVDAVIEAAQEVIRSVNSHFLSNMPKIGLVKLRWAWTFICTVRLQSF